MNSLEMDREVIRCKTCGLVQYRTRTGNCRRCVRALPQRMEYLIPQEAPQEEVAPEAISPKFANQETVENIGQRIRQLRESRSMTQSQLQSMSKVSRSYPSRIESGQMTLDFDCSWLCVMARDSLSWRIRWPMFSTVS